MNFNTRIFFYTAGYIIFHSHFCTVFLRDGVMMGNNMYRIINIHVYLIFQSTVKKSEDHTVILIHCS